MATAAPLLRRHKLDTDAYHRMGEAGIIAAGERVELIRGEVIDIAPIGSRHAGSVALLDDRLRQGLAGKVLVWVQNPLRLDRHNEPQPDLVLLRPRADFYRSAVPTAADVLLLIEVADSSAAHDRTVKMPLYARHGVPEAWLVELVAGEVEVHRLLGPEGYREITRHGQDATLTPLLLPDLRLPLAELLSPASP